jgi:hypothetical protein
VSRNFGAGTRDMASAARILLNRSRVSSGLAFGSVDVVADRFRQFVKFCKLRGVGRLEKINWTFAREYGLDLAGHVDCGEIAPAYAHNLISSVNSVMQLVTNWTPLSATRDCGIRNRSAIRQNVPRGYGLGVISVSVQIVTVRCKGLPFVSMATMDNVASQSSHQWRKLTGLKLRPQFVRATYIPRL